MTNDHVGLDTSIISMWVVLIVKGFLSPCCPSIYLSSPESDGFTCCPLQVQMPVLDGFCATTSIRQMEQSRRSSPDSMVRSMPIVAMTAHAMSGDAERIISAGMDGYISKPLNAKKLQELLQLVATGQLQKSHSFQPPTGDR